jgi:hypothetical protein
LSAMVGGGEAADEGHTARPAWQASSAPAPVRKTPAGTPKLHAPALHALKPSTSNADVFPMEADFKAMV